MLDAIERIVTAECEASRSPRPPDFERFDRFPATDNDADVTDRVAAAFADHFGDRAGELPLQTASEDFSDIPDRARDPLQLLGDRWDRPRPATRRPKQPGGWPQDVPVNHSARFAPVLQPTLDTGTAAWSSPRWSGCRLRE